MIVNYILTVQLLANGITANEPTGLTIAKTLGQFFFLILIFVFILWLASFTTKFIASSKMTSRKTDNIEVIESISVGYQQMALQLVRVADKYFVIGITKDRISFLTDIDGNTLDIKNDDAKETVKVPFEKYLKGFINKGQD